MPTISSWQICERSPKDTSSRWPSRNAPYLLSILSPKRMEARSLNNGHYWLPAKGASLFNSDKEGEGDMKKYICPTCKQDMGEKPHDGLSGKYCPQCGQGISWRRARRREIMTEPKLKPCPFCGGKPDKTRELTEGLFVVVCLNCYADGSLAVSKKSAIDAWNKRWKERGT